MTLSILSVILFGAPQTTNDCCWVWPFKPAQVQSTQSVRPMQTGNRDLAKCQVLIFSWVKCGPCHQLKAAIGDDQEANQEIKAAIAAYKSKTIFVMEDERNKNDPGLQASMKYSVNQYPTVIVIDENGSQLRRYVGFNPNGLIEFLKDRR